MHVKAKLVIDKVPRVDETEQKEVKQCNIEVINEILHKLETINTYLKTKGNRGEIIP